MNSNEMQAVLDSLPVGLLVASAADGAICYANWAAAGLFEQEPEVLLGSSWLHAQWVRGPDGSPLGVERLPLWRSLHEGKTVTNTELWLELPSGTRHAVLVSSRPLRTHGGRITGALVAFQNVAKLPAQPLQDLGKHQERLLRAERLSAIGTFAGGIAHDLRQPLNVLKLNLQLLRQSKTPRSEAEERQIERMEHQVDQAARIIQDLLSLARQEPPRLAPLDLGAVVNQVVAAHGFPGTLRVQVERDPQLPQVPADAGQIRQILDNVIQNAVEAMAEKPGTLAFVVRRAGEWAEIELRDEGGGIPRDQLSRVFEPLFTTRRNGTGLGLTLCQRIAVAHGGEIDMESEEGVGTRVILRLPVQQEANV